MNEQDLELDKLPTLEAWRIYIQYAKPNSKEYQMIQNGIKLAFPIQEIDFLDTQINHKSGS